MNVKTYDRAKLGSNIRTYRHENQLTQEGLAKLAGCSTKTVSKLERGVCGVSVELLFALCAALHCRASELTEGI